MFNFLKKKKFTPDAFHRYSSLAEYEQKKYIDPGCAAVESKIVQDQKEVKLKFYCAHCERETNMAIDFLYAAKIGNDKLIPNFRERVVCEGCGLNNRLRATYHFLNTHFKLKETNLYITEEVTPLFNLLNNKVVSLVGSEYFPDQKTGRIFVTRIGREVNNEDLTALSFRDGQFDLAVSLEVLEHIPDYKKAIGEIYRVLKKGGSFVFSVPFTVDKQMNTTRAIVKNGVIEHLLPPEYHGDPVDNAGCLCFRHFGWEIIDDLKAAGFSEAGIYSYSSAELGYLGGSGVILYAKK